MNKYHLLQCTHNGIAIDLYLGMDISENMHMTISPAINKDRAFRFKNEIEAQSFLDELNRLRSHSHNPSFIRNNKLEYRINCHAEF